MLEYQMCFYKTSIHLTWVLRQTIVILHASYLRILHCDYWRMVRLVSFLSLECFSLKATFSFKWLMYDVCYAFLFGRCYYFVRRIKNNDWILAFFYWPFTCLCQGVVTFTSLKDKRSCSVTVSIIPLFGHCALRTMKRGYFFVKTIKLSTHFTGKLLQGSLLLTIIFVRLLIRILFNIMYRVERQI